MVGGCGAVRVELTIGQSLAPAQLSHSYREFSLSRWTVAALLFFSSSFQYRIFFMAMASNSLASFFYFQHLRAGTTCTAVRDCKGI